MQLQTIEKEEPDFIVEDHATPLNTVIDCHTATRNVVDDFEIIGKQTDTDESGILDENIKVRQTLSRLMGANIQQVAKDPEMLRVMLKAMGDNDKSILAQAKLKAEKEANDSRADIVRDIVTEIARQSDENKREQILRNTQGVRVERNLNVDVREPANPILEGELVIGSGILSDKEVMQTMKGLPQDGTNDSMDEG